MPKKVYILICVMIFFTISLLAEEIVICDKKDLDIVFAGVIPAGTRMVIPPDILKQYDQTRYKHGHKKPFHYLFRYHSKPGPSLFKGIRTTSYIPLVQKDSKDTTQILIDTSNIIPKTSLYDLNTVFMIIHDMEYCKLNKEIVASNLKP